MNLRIKKGGELLFMEGASNNWEDPNELIINFMDKNTYVDHYLLKEDLHINLSNGEIILRFVHKPSEVVFVSYCKDQLILNVKFNETN